LTALAQRPALGSFWPWIPFALPRCWPLGGPANPFSLLYLVQITLSAVVLSKEMDLGAGVLSVAGFGFCSGCTSASRVFEMHHTSEGFSHLVGMWIAFAAAALLITVSSASFRGVAAPRAEVLLLLRLALPQRSRSPSIVTWQRRGLTNSALHWEPSDRSRSLFEVRAPIRDSQDSAVAAEARLIRAEVDRCSHILRQMSARGAEPIGETPAPVGLAEMLERVRRGFSIPAGGESGSRSPRT